MAWSAGIFDVEVGWLALVGAGMVGIDWTEGGVAGMVVEELVFVDVVAVDALLDFLSVLMAASVAAAGSTAVAPVVGILVEESVIVVSVIVVSVSIFIVCSGPATLLAWFGWFGARCVRAASLFGLGLSNFSGDFVSSGRCISLRLLSLALELLVLVAWSVESSIEGRPVGVAVEGSEHEGAAIVVLRMSAKSEE